jgi:hypothetical protein
MGKNKKKKKEKKMFGLFEKNTKETPVKSKSKKPGMVVQSKKTFGFGAAKKTKPVVGEDKETLSVVLYKQSTLDEIARICKPKAGGSEFQVHFRGAQYIVQKKDSNKRIVFTLPTVFFNMPQKVSHASVDFNLDEVAAISQEVQPISFEMAKQLSKAFPIEFFKSLGYDVSIRELEMGSIHRHPGDFGFSGTDLDNQVEKPGVIFRNLKCEDKIQVDSVMYIPLEKVKIVVTETREVTVEPLEDGGIKGQYLESPTVSYILQDKVYNEGFGEFFGGEDDSSEEFKYIVNQKWIDKEYPQIKDIFDAFLSEIDYDPTLIIDPELIKQEFASWHKRSNTTYNRTYGNHTNSYYDDYEDDDYTSWAYNDETISTSNLPSSKEKEILTRPSWRKTQTLGKLRVAKIDLSKYPEIDGTAEDSDIIAIVDAMKDAGYDDKEIRQLFTDCAYPPNAMSIYYNSLADSI